jgi:hypothetical protein
VSDTTRHRLLLYYVGLQVLVDLVLDGGNVLAYFREIGEEGVISSLFRVVSGVEYLHELG